MTAAQRQYTGETRPTGQLRPHKLNEQVYGAERIDPALRESIAEDGIITPLVIDQDDTILSGHRRWRVARASGLAFVPVVVREIADPLDGERILIESNRQREKTTTQRQREADELARIIGAQARERMADAGRTFGRGMTRDEIASAQLSQSYAGEPGAQNEEPSSYDSAPDPAPAPRIETAERVAELLGVSRATFKRERTVYQTATGQREAPPEVRMVAGELLKKLDAGTITPYKADRDLRDVVRLTEARADLPRPDDAHTLTAAALDSPGVREDVVMREYYQLIGQLLRLVQQHGDFLKHALPSEVAAATLPADIQKEQAVAPLVNFLAAIDVARQQGRQLRLVQP